MEFALVKCNFCSDEVTTVLVTENIGYKVKAARQQPQPNESSSLPIRENQKQVKAPDPAPGKQSDAESALRELDQLIEAEGGILTP